MIRTKFDIKHKTNKIMATIHGATLNATVNPNCKAKLKII